MALQVERSTVGMQRALNRVADTTERVRVQQEKYNQVLKDSAGDQAKVAAQYQRFAKAQRDHSVALQQASVAQRDHALSLSELGSGASSATTGIMGLGAAMRGLSSAAGPIAVSGLVVGIGQLAGVAAAAAQSVALLPGVIGAAGVAFGTLKIATLGFSDAMESIKDPEKFVEAIRELSPNAQQAALAIQSLMPQLEQLKNATQDAFFANVGPQLDQLANQFLPTIQQMTTGVAGAFNGMLTGVTNQLMTPETQLAIQNITTNITEAFQALAPAAAPLTQAFTDIMSVGTSFLPSLASAASEAARAFSVFITEARQSGALQEFMQGGVDALKQVAAGAGELTEAFFALAPIGQQLLPDIVEMLGHMNDLMPGIVATLVVLGPHLEATNMLMSGWVKELELIKSGFDGIKTVVQSVGNAVIPVINAIGEAVDKALGPLYDYTPIAQLDLNRPGVGGGAFLPKSGSPSASSSGGPFSGGFEHQTPPGQWWIDTRPGWNPAQATSDAIRDQFSGGGATGPPMPVVPYNGDPMSLLQGFAPTASLYGAAESVLTARHARAQAESDLHTLERSNQATEEEIQEARNKLARTDSDVLQSEMRLQEAKASATNKYMNQLDGLSSQLGEVGAQLDQDFGISKGLAGIAENITRFLANLSFAPAIGALQAVQAASGFDPATGGGGLVGIMAAQGAFGPQFMPGATSYPSASNLGPAAFLPGFGGGQPYGLPIGTNSGGYGQGGAEFPPWVHALGAMFGVKPSTYPGHQEGSGLNKGIDWSGPVDNMQRFAEYLATIPGSLEQVIWDNPNTPQRDLGIADGQFVGPGTSQPGYYSSDWGDHQDHVHTRQSFSLPMPGGVPMPQWSADWNAIAQGESGGNWGINTGNGYQGGLQFSPSSWAAAGGTQYAPSADLATPFQQALTAEQLLAMQGPGAWPNTFVPGSSGPPPGPGWAGPGVPAGVTGGGGQSPIFGATVGRPIGAGVQAGPGGLSAPSSVTGGMQPAAAGGGGFAGIGGLPLDAAMAATSALDMLAPGAGAAAKIGIQLANRAAGYAGQVAGIGVSGLMETFLPSGSPLGNIGNSWLGKLAGGFAGARPALPNIAGGQAKPINPQQGQPAGPQSSIGTNIEKLEYNAQNQTEDRNGADLTNHLSTMHQGPSRVGPG